jgi:hypothetical protein
MPTYDLDDATDALITRIADMLERSNDFVVREAVVRWHRDLLRADASRAAEDLILRLASTTITDADLVELRALDPRSLMPRDDSADLLFRFVSRSWFEVFHERRPLQEDADRRVIEALLAAGLRADASNEDAGALDWLFEVAEEGLVFQAPHTALSRLRDLDAFFGDEPAIARQHDWLRESTGADDDVLGRLDRSTLGFRGEAAIALVVGRRLRDVSPARWEALSARLVERDDLVLVPGADLSQWRGQPIEAVIGWPIQLAFASEGLPEELEVASVREALQALPELGLADLEGDEGAFLVAVGPLASGHVVRGTPGAATDLKTQGAFHLGCTMDQLPHSYGVWGEALLHVSWEDARVTRWPVEPLSSLRGRVFMVTRYD